jgi:adenine-specific DNA methylase
MKMPKKVFIKKKVDENEKESSIFKNDENEKRKLYFKNLMKMPKKKLYDCMKDFLKYILNICHF